MASAIGHSPKIVPDVREFAVQFGQFVRDDFGKHMLYGNAQLPGRVAQSVTCLVTDAKLTADPGVASLIPARSHTFVEIDHEIISTVILLPSAQSFMKGCCQLQAKVCAQLLVNCLFKLAQGKRVVR